MDRSFRGRRSLGGGTCGFRLRWGSRPLGVRHALTASRGQDVITKGYQRITKGFSADTAMRAIMNDYASVCGPRHHIHCGRYMTQGALLARSRAAVMRWPRAPRPACSWHFNRTCSCCAAVGTMRAFVACHASFGAPAPQGAHSCVLSALVTHMTWLRHKEGSALAFLSQPKWD